MAFVVLGMKQYREINDGFASYWSSVKTGVLITLFPSIAFGLYNLLYSYVIDPEFFYKYAEYSISKLGTGKTAEEIEVISATVNAEIEMYSNPVIQFFAMFVTVFLIGVMVSIIAGFFIKKNKPNELFKTIDSQ